jgi:hypothetical protein
MARTVALLSATAAGPAIQHTTMVSTWAGRMPSALNTPRSYTRSLVVISTVLSTPSPAATATMSASRLTRPPAIV